MPPAHNMRPPTVDTCLMSSTHYTLKQVRALSMEVDSIEDFFGPEAFAGLKENIKQQWEANRQRIDSLIAVRKVSYRACTQVLSWRKG